MYIAALFIAGAIAAHGLSPSVIQTDLNQDTVIESRQVFELIEDINRCKQLLQRLSSYDKSFWQSQPGSKIDTFSASDDVSADVTARSDAASAKDEPIASTCAVEGSSSGSAH